MENLQHTLNKQVVFQGIALHKGVDVKVKVLPAPENTGIVFIRPDINPDVEIKASPENIVCTVAATTLGLGDITVGTVEHLMAALAGYGVDNAKILVYGPELPAMDGSAGLFLSKFKEIGLKEQGAPRKYIRVLKRLEVKDGNKSLVIEPYQSFALDVSISFDHPVIGVQHYRCSDLTFAEFDQNISRARTFGFLDQVEEMRKHGLALGGSRDNAVVIGDKAILNQEGLRFENEMARHKALDLIGDLALFSPALLAKVTAKRNGHELHRKLMLKLLADRDAWVTTSLLTEIPTIEWSDQSWDRWSDQRVAVAAC